MTYDLCSREFVLRGTVHEITTYDRSPKVHRRMVCSESIVIGASPDATDWISKGHILCPEPKLSRCFKSEAKFFCIS